VSKSPGSGSGNVLGAHAPTTRTGDPTDLGFEQALGQPEVKVSPTPGRTVVVRPCGPTTGTLAGTHSPAVPHHHTFGREGHARDGHSIDGEDAVKCSSGARIVPLGLVCLNASETLGTAYAPLDDGQAFRRVTVNPSGDWSLERTASRERRQTNRGNPRGPLNEVSLIKSFSNAFSNADGYVRSRPNVSEVKGQYSNRQGSPVNVSELKKTAWHARGQEFESPYLQLSKFLIIGFALRHPRFVANP
jgi:hypothetical protein